MLLDLRAFALQLYQRPDVESACRRLQAQGADVCLLLCGAWLEARGISCTSGRCAALRRLRQDWRTAARDEASLDVLRERLKALELDAEWELLRRLEAACRDWPADPGAGDAWLEGLMETTADSCDALETLRAATHAD